MWWILPWLLFLGCLAGIAFTHLLWRRKQSDRQGEYSVLTHDIEDYR